MRPLSLLVSVLVSATMACSGGPYAMRGSWEKPPAPSLVVLERAEGRAVLPLGDGDVAVGGEGGWQDRARDFLARVTPDGAVRWALHFRACDPDVMLLEGEHSSIWFSVTGLLALGADVADKKDPYRSCHDGVRARVGSFVQVSRDGRVLARVDAPGEYGNGMPPALFATPGGGVLSVGGDKLVSIDREGRIASTRQLEGGMLRAPPVRASDLIIAVDETWRPQTTGAADSPLAVSESDCRIQALRLDGERAWSRPLHLECAGRPLALEARGDRVVVNLGDRMVGIDAATGAEVWRSPGITPDSPGPAAGGAASLPRVLSRDEVVLCAGFVVERGVERVDYVAVDARTGRSRLFARFIGETMRLKRDMTLEPMNRPQMHALSRDSLWIVGTFNGRLGVDGTSVETEADVVPYCGPHDVECFGHRDEYVVVSAWGHYLARLPFRR